MVKAIPKTEGGKRAYRLFRILSQTLVALFIPFLVCMSIDWPFFESGWWQFGFGVSLLFNTAYFGPFLVCVGALLLCINRMLCRKTGVLTDESLFDRVLFLLTAITTAVGFGMSVLIVLLCLDMVSLDLSAFCFYTYCGTSAVFAVLGLMAAIRSIVLKIQQNRQAHDDEIQADSEAWTRIAG